MDNTRKELFLVFDLDETIANITLPTRLNPKVLNILIQASSLRGRGIEAICLLTNNSDKSYIAYIDSLLLEITGSIGRYGSLVDDDMPKKDYFFDYIASREHPIRIKGSNSAKFESSKQYIEIKRISDKLGYDYDQKELMSRLYFFDDQLHLLKIEFKYSFDGLYEDHYIQVTPSFNERTIDKTNYNPILEAFRKIEKENYKLNGGKMRSSNKKRRTHKKRKQSKH
jgi:hypothetical protein|uniref:FCP1 homology domain-containing protein n=1 Tax=viral metagenome TaxID=1070528 RepID=A0A6C0HE50_9ZZZZ